MKKENILEDFLTLIVGVTLGVTVIACQTAVDIKREVKTYAKEKDLKLSTRV